MLLREEREMQRQYSALRRVRRQAVGVVDLPERRRSSLFDAAALEVLEQHRDLLWQRLAAHSRALTAAKDRMSEGTYGLCAQCGRPIPQRRLKVLPTATLCVQCQERREAALAA
jgi:phage/conjugal plasmid C-4 type zinc finger TraR family protein